MNATIAHIPHAIESLNTIEVGDTVAYNDTFIAHAERAMKPSGLELTTIRTLRAKVLDVMEDCNAVLIRWDGMHGTYHIHTNLIRLVRKGGGVA